MHEKVKVRLDSSLAITVNDYLVPSLLNPMARKDAELGEHRFAEEVTFNQSAYDLVDSLPRYIIANLPGNYQRFIVIPCQVISVPVDGTQ